MGAEGVHGHSDGARLGVWLGLLLPLLAACSSFGPAPVIDRNSPVGTSPPPPPTEIVRDWYRVETGDTLYSIAWRGGLDYRQLAAWNAIGPPYTIVAGQLLRLRPRPVAERRHANPRPPVPGSPKPQPRVTAAAPVSAPVARPTTGRAQPSASRTTPTGHVNRPRSELVWRWPASGVVISGFEQRDRTRQGLKIGGRLGQPVVAAESGRVVYSGSGLIGYGQLIILKHDNNYLSAYGHNRKLLVREGVEVTRGERIAEMGIPLGGERPLLHFEIRRNGTPVDPAALLPR